MLVFDIPSMQDATEDYHFPELAGEPLRLELNITFLLKDSTVVIVLRERMSSVAIDKFELLEKVSKADIVSLQQIIYRISLLKYRYLDSFPSNYVPFLPNETCAFISTQPSNM